MARIPLQFHSRIVLFCNFIVYCWGYLCWIGVIAFFSIYFLCSTLLFPLVSTFDISVGWLGRFDNFKRSREDYVGVGSLLEYGECSALFGSGFDVWLFARFSISEVGGRIGDICNFSFLGGVICVCAKVLVIILVENFPLSVWLFWIVGVSEVVVVSFLSRLSKAFIWLIKLP